MDVALRVLAEFADDEPAEAVEAGSLPSQGGQQEQRKHGGRRPGSGRRKAGRESGRGRGLSGRGSGRGERSAKAKGKTRHVHRPLSKQERLFKLQAESLNTSGRARTADHLVLHTTEARPKVRGTGKWKSWTPQAVMRAGFGAEVTAQRCVANQIDGAGHRQSADARYIVSNAVVSWQDKMFSEVRRLPLDFYIHNIMWDETTFDLSWDAGGASATHSVLCSHAQVSYRVNVEEAADVSEAHGPGVKDHHIIRVPQVLPRYNAGTVSGALHRLPGGLQEHVEAPLCATLASCDAHRANLKCLRQLHCSLPNNHMLLISVCTQHRAANVVEALTKAIGNLTGVFCLSKVFNYQNVLLHLRKHLKARLEQVVHRVHEPPLAQRAEWERAAAAAQDLVKLCSACQEPSDSEAAKSPMEELLDFFPGPWTGQTGAGEVGIVTGRGLLWFCRIVWLMV